jgi:serine/threonine-protein kinase
MSDGFDCVLLRHLGSGSVTQIWYARTVDGRPCAAKFPLPSWAGHRGVARLVEREWEFLELGAQKGVVKTFGLVTQDSGPMLLTEFLPGGDLVALAGSHPRYWAAALRDVALTLEAVHGRGIVHRDIKPRNVLFDAAGRATLIDFAVAMGIGRTSRVGGGTPAYQSPRHRQGAQAAPADDLHAFAVMVYELLTGQLPFGLMPDAKTLETRPPSPLKRVAPLAREEPDIVALAELTEAELTRVSTEPAQALRLFQSTLQAIITT